MNVRFLGVIALFIRHAVVVTVRKFVVIVFVRVPIHTVFHVAEFVDVVGDVPVIVRMRHRRMRMFGLSPFTFGVLILSHGCTSFPGEARQKCS